MNANPIAAIEKLVDALITIRDGNKAHHEVSTQEAPTRKNNGCNINYCLKQARSPELARTLDSIIQPFLVSVGSDDKKGHIRTPENKEHRHLVFSVPSEKIEGFVEYMDQVTNYLKGSGELQNQYRNGCKISADINAIAGAKPYLLLDASQSRFSLDGNLRINQIREPFFNLEIKGNSQSFQAISQCIDHHSGKDALQPVHIAMNKAWETKAIMEKIHALAHKESQLCA